jgi:hypothetical protein
MVHNVAHILELVDTVPLINFQVETYFLMTVKVDSLSYTAQERMSADNAVTGYLSTEGGW